MENAYLPLVFVALGVSLVIFLILKFSNAENRSENMIRFAIVCVGLSVVFTLLSAWYSGQKSDLFKLSAPLTILIIVLAARMRKRKKEQKNS